METTTNTKTYLTEDFFKKECLREFYTREDLYKMLRTNMKAWSWGAHDYALVEKTLLRFKVQGHHFKGMLWIGVNGSDLFNIYLSKGRRSENGCYELVEKISDVYIEDLIDRIDQRVEYISQYKR
jgi:hypothetical protein